MAPLFTLVQPEHREFNGGDLLAQSLKHLGVSIAFGLHGGHLDAFLMGAVDVGIKLVDTRHETVAVQAAEGYSKIKRETGVCFVTANSGFCNGIPGLATAFADRSSVLCITSSSPMRDAETNVLQGFHDQVVLSRPVTKFAHRVVHVEEIPRLVAHAFRTASSGVPEVLFSPVEQSRISWGSLASPQPYPAGPHPQAIVEAVEMLKQAKRPIIVTGTGARYLQDDAAFTKFLDMTKIPVFNSTKYSSPLAHDHPQRAGIASMLGALPKIGQPLPDLVILLACRTGMFMGSRSEPCIPSPETCKYIQIDVDGSEIGRSQDIHLGIVSDVRPAIASLAAAIPDTTQWQIDADWAQKALSLKTLPHPQESEPEEVTPNRLHPYHALKHTLSALPPGALLSVDGGECGSWTLQTQEAARAHAVVFSCGYLGFLGNGWGYALGMAFADPQRQVVNVQGDGSAGFHLAELDTYARFGCRVLTVVVNNHVWGMSNNGQELIFGRNIAARPVSALSPKMAFAEIARGMANAAERVDSIGDVAAAVKRLSAVDGPALLEIVTSNKPTHPGTTAMVGVTDDKNMVVIPYYDNVPRPHYKQRYFYMHYLNNVGSSYSSSFSFFTLALSPPVAALPVHTAGVPASIRYTHFSSSIIFQISSFSAHARTTVVLRSGPCQQCAPSVYFKTTRSPVPKPLPSAVTSSSE
ncbi:hypothetical protein FH972_021675 [Carpinus fangiana]|uniref:Pyruvate decarboxylase n=1 Tax=Carpinus fangiana TaxID=176857 RepID=A0A5N6KQD3_9ROSI|nr:hypothetical protein FH972_021675 [Carpinus fangiana]